jgi:long-chain acyl-CoA synthetase
MRMVNNLKAKPPMLFSDLRDMVYKCAEKFGDKNLYTYSENDLEKTWSYNDLKENLDAVGTALSMLGLQGKRIAVIGDTHPMYTTIYLSAITGNGTIIPLDKELDISQIAAFLNHAEADAVAYTAQFNEKIPALQKEIPNVKLFIPIQPAQAYKKSKNTISADDLIALGKQGLADGNTSYTSLDIILDRRSAILFTSGTTGTSKGVMLSHKNLISSLNSATHSMSYDDECTFVSVLPIHHTYEMMCGQLGVIAIGGSQLINPSIKRVLKSFKDFKPTTLVLVPLFLETMHKKIWDEIRKKGMEKKVRAAMKMNAGLLNLGVDVRAKLFGQITAAFGGNLTSIVCGGAPIDPQIIIDFYHFGITVLEGYGITECSPLVAVNSPGKVRFRSVGTPVADVEVKIDYDESNETGEILVRGNNVMLGYYKDEEASAKVFTDDGFFRTGDIGYIKDGYIYITGRKKNVIILSNGKNVFPEELEEYLSKIPFALESVVIGRENERKETVITAIIVPDTESPELAEKSNDEIYETVKAAVVNINKHLPSFKHIADVEIRYEEFEKNTSKKIKRYLIK